MMKSGRTSLYAPLAMLSCVGGAPSTESIFTLLSAAVRDPALAMPGARVFDTTSLIAEFDPVSAPCQLIEGWSSLNRAVSACTAGRAPPPPLAVYWPLIGSGVGDGGAVTPHAATRHAAARAPRTLVAVDRRCAPLISTPGSGKAG